MFNLSFGSTYRIPITQPGANNSKKEKLRNLVESYPNGLIGKSKTGYARVSVPEEADNTFESRLKCIGYRVFQKFDGHDISKENLDLFIKEKLDTRDYNQKGKKMKKMSREMKEQRRYERRFTPPEKEKLHDTNADNTALESINEESSDFNKEIIKQTSDITKGKKTALKDSYKKDSLTKEEIERIKNTESYKSMKDAYGEDFANAVFFDLR